MRHGVHQEVTLLKWRSDDVRLFNQELDAVFDEHPFHDEGDTPFLLIPETVSAEFHSDSNIQLEEPLDTVEIPCM